MCARVTRPFRPSEHESVKGLARETKYDFRWKTLDRESRFPKLFRLMTDLLCIDLLMLMGERLLLGRSTLMKSQLEPF